MSDYSDTDVHTDTHVVETRGGEIPHAGDLRRFPASVDVPSARDPLETMPTGTFSSSNVHSGLYDFGERQLFMRYLRDGPDAIYIYWQVPVDEWKGLTAAASKGSYINANVAFEYEYAKAGRGDFPARNAIGDDLLRRFVYDP
jgi:hypothetical protein